MTPFILFPEEYRPVHRDVQIFMRSGRVAQPPPVDRPFAGIDARDEIQREDDEILRQLCTTQARISIWSLLASSSTHRDALIRALSQIRVDTTTTPKDRRALRQLATRFFICGDALYRRSPDGLLLLCLDHASANRVMSSCRSLWATHGRPHAST